MSNTYDGRQCIETRGVAIFFAWCKKKAKGTRLVPASILINFTIHCILYF